MTMKIIVALIAILSICAIKMAHGKIHFQEIHFETNPEFMKTHATLKNESGIVTSDIETEFMQDLDGKLMVHVEIFKKVDNKYDNIFTLPGKNICEFYRDHSAEPVMKMILDQVTKYGNIPDGCPIKKGHYSVKDFHMEDFSVPSMVPRGDYRVDVKLNDENGETKLIYKTMWKAQIYPDS